MFNIAIGHSEDPDSADAADEVIAACQSRLGNIKPQVCMVFSAIDYDYPVILKKIHAAFAGVQVVGCTSSGELSSQLGYSEDSLLLVALASDRIKMATAVVRNMSENVVAGVKK